MNLKFAPIIAVAAATVACQAQTIEGYDDLYIDKNKTITVLTIMCGDINRLNSLRPVVVYTNNGQIDEAAYSYKSSYGEFSYIFKQIEPGKPVMARGLLSNGETDKSKAKQDMCIVKQDSKLPKKLNSMLKKDVLEPSDPKWESTMSGLSVVAGAPAYAKGVFK